VYLWHGKKLAEEGVSNGTDNERGIVSKVVTGCCREKYGTDSKNVTSAEKKYFLMKVL